MESSSKDSNIASVIALNCVCEDDEEAGTTTVSDVLTSLKEMIAYVRLNLQYPSRALTW